ncbi:MAG TPA: hypothetical protein GX509_04660 [Firmicutes bacterium]|nr:hypothetical protein [Bacillota bacterium]HHY98013.1 hypothetical protein [Bacillota bacterium]
MISREKKIEALNNFTAMVANNPALTYLMGYLTGQVDRVHFVKDLTSAEIAVRISQDRLTVWPAEPFRATVSGLIVLNPLSFAASVSNMKDPICVSLNFENSENAPWYQEVLLPDVSYVKGAEEAAEDKAKELRSEMDRTLDIYRECKRLLESDTGERRKELDYYLTVAQNQLRELNRQLEQVTLEINRLSEK